MSLFDKTRIIKILQEKKKDNPGDALRKAIGKQSELDAAKDFKKDVGKNITPELKNTLNKKQDNLNRFFTDQPDSKTLKTKPTGDENKFKSSKVKFDSGAKGKFASGSPDLGGAQKKFVKDRRRKLDVEINKRRSAELTKSDAINKSMGGGSSTEGTGGANQGQLKKYKPPSKAESDAIQSKSALNKSKKYASGEYPKIGGGDRVTPKSKGRGASTGGQKNLVVNPKSKGTTPVKVNITKPIKQSEVSKKAKEFTAKINKANVKVQKNYVGRKAVRIKNATFGKKTGSLRKGNLSFPGDRSGAYQATKSDIEARKGFKGAKTQTGAGKTKTIPGLKADEKNPFVKTSVRKGRAADLGGNIFDQPKFSQKDFETSLKKKFPKSAKTASQTIVTGGGSPGTKPPSNLPTSSFKKPPDPFKTSTTKTGSFVKDFKFQPRDLKTSQAEKKAAKSFSQFRKDLSKAGANIDIEKKLIDVEKKASGNAYSGNRSKGSGSRRTNIGGGGSGRSGGGNTGNTGSGSGGGSGGGRKGGILTPPDGSGGSSGGDGSGFRGKYNSGKQRITGDYDDVTAAKNMKWKNLFRKASGGGRKVDTIAPGYTPRKIKGYSIFTNKKLDAGQRAQKILQGRSIKKNLPKGLKFTKPLVQNIARNPAKYGKAGLVAAGVLGTAAIIKKMTTPKPGQLTSKDFEPTTAIKDRSGKNVRFTYSNDKTKDGKPLYGDKASPFLTKDALAKFRSGEYTANYKTGGKVGKKIDIDASRKNSAFTKQLKDASKGTGFLGRQTDKDRKFLKKYKEAAKSRNIKVPTTTK